MQSHSGHPRLRKVTPVILDCVKPLRSSYMGSYPQRGGGADPSRVALPEKDRSIAPRPFSLSLSLCLCICLCLPFSRSTLPFLVTKRLTPQRRPLSCESLFCGRSTQPRTLQGATGGVGHTHRGWRRREASPLTPRRQRPPQCGPCESVRA